MDAPQGFLLFKISIIKRCLLIVLVASLASLLLGQEGFSLGVLIGGCIAICIFSLLSKYVLALGGLSSRQRKRFLIPKALLIYAIMGITLFIAIKKGLPVFLGTAAGLLTLKAAIFAEVFKKKTYQRMS